jgi:hypothetical protein
MKSTIVAGPSSRNRPITLGDLMRQKGPAWAARCLERRYRLRRKHAALVVEMLGLERGR